MKTKYKLDKPFGEIGNTIGFVMIIAGAAAAFNSLYALILVVVGAFIVFAAKYTILDLDKKKVKSSDHFFGLIPTGKWIDIKPDMKLGLKKSHRGYRAYSRGNRQLDIHQRDLRIVLYNPENKILLEIEKFNNLEAATKQLEKLSKELSLTCI